MAEKPMAQEHSPALVTSASGLRRLRGTGRPSLVSPT